MEESQRRNRLSPVIPGKLRAFLTIPIDLVTLNIIVPFEPPYLLDITHAPNHFRCWRKSFYDRIGGHDKTLSVGDDYELLLRTFLQAKKTIHIAECFYLYRVFPNGGNTFSIRQNELRNVINIFYFKEYVNVAVKHAKNNNWKCLDLGSGPCKENGFLGIDMFPSENVDIVADLSQKWPFEDGSVGVIRAHDFIEHIHDPVFFFDEAYRVLAPNGLLMIKVPSANCLAAYRDPTHVSFYNSDTFRFFYEDGVAAKFKDRIHCGFTRFKIFETEQCGVTYIHCHLFSNKFIL
jgi:SAM-dependent methyltransferase